MLAAAFARAASRAGLRAGAAGLSLGSPAAPRALSGAAGLSHVSPDGSEPRMVDVSDKRATKRTAEARALVRLPPHVMDALTAGDGTLSSAKGPVFATAIIAGVQGAKRTSDLIPFCHPLPLENCRVALGVLDDGTTVEVRCTATVTHKTGVEMEALVGASTAALCVYDMVKALSHDIVIDSVELVSKRGGKSDVDRS